MDEEFSGGRRRLPGHDGYDQEAADAGLEAARTRRDVGVRGTRRASNLTAAALIAGVAVTSGYFAHAAATGTPLTGSAGAVQQGQQSQQSQQVQQVQPASHRAHLTHPVVTSGGSGVTVGGGGSGASGAGPGQSGGSGSAAAWRDN